MSNTPSTGDEPARVGVVLPLREAAASGGHDLTKLLDMATRAEQAGLDSVWLSDSPLARPRADPLTLAAAVAARTDHVLIGTAALIPALRDPVLCAHSIATVDRLSAGRIVVGVGAGFPYPATADEFTILGRPFRGRHAILDQTVALWKALWSGRLHGEMAVGAHAYPMEALAGMPPPHRPGGPPVWLAAGASAATRRRLDADFDGWLPYLPDLQGYEAMAQVTSGVTHAMYTTIAIDPDPLSAAETLDAYLLGYYGVDADVLQGIQMLHAGTPESALDHLQALAAAGVSHIVVRLAGPEPIDDVEALGALRRILRSEVPA